MALEFGKNGYVSEEEYRANVRPQAQETFGKPVQEWHDIDYHFIAGTNPISLDEALQVARELGHREGIGAIAITAHQKGLDLRHSDPDSAAQFAAIVDSISTDPQGYYPS